MRFLTIFLILLICEYGCTLNDTVGWCTKIESRYIRVCPSRNSDYPVLDTRDVVYSIEMRMNCKSYKDQRIVSTCCEGYTEVYERCEPICKPSCLRNSYCLRPNFCVCEDGYLRNNVSALKIQCKPVCDRQCKENSFCIAPNKCACNLGFKGNTNGTCSPTCEPSCNANASCVAPNKCACNKGFKDNGSGICLPVCEPSCNANASCIATKKCVSNAMIMPIKRFQVPWNFIGIVTILTSFLSATVYVKYKIGEYPNKAYQV